MIQETELFLSWIEAHPELWLFERDVNPPDQPAETLRSIHSMVMASLVGVPRYIHPRATIHETAIVEGNVVVDAEAQILPYAMIQGPAYIGRRAVVGNFSLLRKDCFLARDSLVGNHCYCNEAVIGPSARVAHYVNFSRSLLAYNSAVSAFVLTATVRANKEPVRSVSQAVTSEKLGVVVGPNTFVAPHVTLSPGISIGSRSFIGSFALITKDIENDVFIAPEQKLFAKANTVAIPKRKRVARFSSSDGQQTTRRYAGVLLVDRSGNYVLQRRDNKPTTLNGGRLSAFGGRLEGDESAVSGAKRELFEETGLRVRDDEMTMLTMASFEREDGSTTACTMFVVTDVDASQISVQEGVGFELVSVGAASTHPDLTDLCRLTIAAYVQGPS